MSTRSSNKCVICKRRRTSNSGVFLASLPIEPDRCKLWVQAIGQEDLVYLPIEKLHELKFVCALHFDRNDFNEKGNRLRKLAVPSLLLPFPPLREELFKDFPFHVGFKRKQLNVTDHDYCKTSDAAVEPCASTSNAKDENVLRSYKRQRKSCDEPGTLDKINKINEDQRYDNGIPKVHADHSYSLQQKPFYHSDLELVAELSDYTKKQYAGQTKDSEEQENSGTTSNDIIGENEDTSQIASKRQEVQTCRRYSADKGNSNSSSNDFDSVNQNGSQINSKSRNQANRNNSNSNAHERNSAMARYTYSFNITADNVIDVIRNESDITAEDDVTALEDITGQEDVTAPEAETCITDDKEYRFDGHYFDDGLPTIVEPEPDVPEAVFSWQTELNLFPLDDVVNLEVDVLDVGDAVCPDARAARPALAVDASLYDPGAPEVALDAEYQCNECHKEITRSRYTCVQCADWDLCGACEAHGAHAAHYLLRIPSLRPYSEIQTVLAAIRQQLLRENLFLRPDIADNDWPAEVKEERDFGEDSAGEHTSTEDSSDESDGSWSPRRKRPRHHPATPASNLTPTRHSHTEHVDLTDDVHHETEQLLPPEQSVALPDSIPVANIEIPKDLITSILSSRASEVTYGSFKSLARRKGGGNSLLKPILTERIPENGRNGTSCNSPKVADNLTEQQRNKTRLKNQPCDDLPTVIIEDDTVEKSVRQSIQQKTLPVNVLRTNAVKMIPNDSPVSARPVGQRMTTSQFIDKGFDDNLPTVILEDDEDDHPTETAPRKSLLQPNDLTKQLAHNSPKRMDIDSSPTARVTRSKRKLEKELVCDRQNIQKNESLLQSIGKAIETLDFVIQEDDIVDITEEVPDTSRLTEASETVVLRVPPGSNVEALTQALQSTAFVLLEPLQHVFQKTTSRKRLK